MLLLLHGRGQHWPHCVVMIIVLGVTLLGEGLRRQLQGELELRPSLLDRALNWMAGPLSATSGRAGCGALLQFSSSSPR